ncbi:EamA family transporter [Chitinophaga caeni]|uniref:EamA family transporter n=1 Tax=Chitinophaga caeni TaxID=2029983 RepID=A0A291QPT6_9BACT|nr:DMT family transporter [Chitinophaga caeni]ATL45913.1 EamA family transporter [Chitinophaga caeni]
MWKGAILVLTGACSFGILSTIVKSAYKEGFTLSELCGMQAGIGMLILWLIFAFGKKSTGLQGNLKHGLVLLLMGTSTGLVSICYYYSVQYIPASIAILLLMQFTWMNILVDSFIRKRRPGWIELICVLLILAGTAMASGMVNNVYDSLPWVGILFGLMAAAFYTVFMTVNASNRLQFTPVLKSAWMVTGAFIIVSIILPPTYLVNGRLWESPLILWGLPLAVFGTVLPPLLYAKGMPKVGLSLGGILSAAELPVAVFAAAIVLKEPVSGLQILGLACILLAIVWANLTKKTAR